MNYYRFFLFLFLISIINTLLFSIQGFGFIPIKFGNKINKRNDNNEISKTILLNKEKESESAILVKKIDGFFGMIGPDVSIPIPNNMNNLFDLFSKNGVLQGVFISNGTIHFVRKYIKTEKWLYEERFGEIPIHPITLLLFEIGKIGKMLPNIFGLANTALLNYQNKVYVLNERDLPYEIQVNFLNKEIQTKQKLALNSKIHHFLAHSKIGRGYIETLDYSIFSKKINWFQFDEKWNMKKQIEINKKYISMVHDFISLENHILFIDCPLSLQYDLKNRISFQLSKNQKHKSSLFIIEKATGNKKIIDLGENCFLFHYGNSFENEKEIEFYGCFYDGFDFKTSKKNSGKFRKVTVNKNKGTAEIIKNKDLENFSLDFPIFYKNYTILTHSFESKNINFIVVKKFELHKVIDLDNKCINGEASVIEILDKPYLICFAYKENNISNATEHYLCIYGIETNDSTSVLIPFNLTFGFHSIFLKSFC